MFTYHFHENTENILLFIQKSLMRKYFLLSIAQRILGGSALPVTLAQVNLIRLSV